MKKFDIFCFTSKNFNFLNRLPKNIIPIGLGDNDYPENYLNETTGVNLSKYNKYYAEMSGIYWVFKNKIHHYNKDDYLGFCHYRRLWLDDLYPQNHKEYTNIFSKILHKRSNLELRTCETFLLDPTRLKNENIYDHFVNNHGRQLLDELPNILQKELYEPFLEYMKKNEFSACNMFITKPKYFIEYCNFVFPLLDKILYFCLNKNLCHGVNIKLPAFFIERFTSFWFHHYTKIEYLSYAQLGSFFTSNASNKFVNTLKTPLSFLFYPTSLDV